MLQIKDLTPHLSHTADFPHAMHGSGGTGQPLVKLGTFAADLIRFQPGKCVQEHTHPGDHLLICFGGTGTLVYDGQSYPIAEGTIYMVPGSVRHAILTTEADQPLTLMSIATQHYDVASPERSRFE